MVLLQDIDFIDRQIANVRRNIARLEDILQAGAKRGQFPGSQSPCSFKRRFSQDCGAWRSVQGIPAQLEPLKKELDDLLFTREQQTQILELEIEEPVIITPPITPIREEPVIITLQNNTLRNALIVGGALLLIL